MSTPPRLNALLPEAAAGIFPLHGAAPEIRHGIVSQALLATPALRVTLMHFAAGQELSEHTSSARALVQVVAGSAEFTYDGRPHLLQAGDLLHLPPALPHAVRALTDLTLLLTQAARPTPPSPTPA